MPAKRQWTEEQLEIIRQDFHSDLTGKQVAVKFKSDYTRSIKPLWLSMFGAELLHARFRRNCAASKLGNNNPMTGRTGTKHHNHKSSYITSSGYRMVDVPDWWEGSTKASKYLEHIINGCEKYGLTRPTKGYVFHHIDEDKLNNLPDNLQMLSIAEHMALHKNATRKV